MLEIILAPFKFLLTIILFPLKIACCFVFSFFAGIALQVLVLLGIVLGLVVIGFVIS